MFVDTNPNVSEDISLSIFMDCVFTAQDVWGIQSRIFSRIAIPNIFHMSLSFLYPDKVKHHVY